MALSLTNSFNISDGGVLELDGASYVTAAAVGSVTYVFVAGRDDNGISVFSLAADGTLTNVFNFADNATTNLGGVFALTTAVVGDTTYLFTSAISESGVSVFSVGADGALTNVANVADNATLQLALTADVTTAVVDGTTYLFADGVNDNGISVFSVAANGALTNVENVNDDGTSRIQGPQGMTTAVVGGTTYLFVTGYHDDGVGVYSVAANGDLTNVFNVQDSGPLELDGPVDAITAVVEGTTYLFVGGFEDDGVSVFSVAANGALTNVFNLADSGPLELDNPVGMSVAVLGGTTYLFVAGADDDGLSVFSVAANGALTNVENVTDGGLLELDRALGVTTVAMNGQIQVIVASNTDDGVSTFTLSDGTSEINDAPTLTATGNNPTFTEDGGAADLYGAPVASTVEPGQTFTSLTLTVTNVTDGADEILSFLGTDIALTDGNSVAGVTVSVVGTTATVTFPGAPDAASLQQLIDALAYRNTSQNPTGADRVITITQLVDSGGTADGGDDTATLTIVSTVDVDPTNDAAVIDGDTTGDVTEAGTTTATGNLDSTDVDNAADAWQAVAAGTVSIGGYGTYELGANGVWSYTLDQGNAAVQALNGADTLTDSFTALTADGTSQTVTITIHAQNDPATITGDIGGTVVEAGGVANGTVNAPTETGDLDSIDPDNSDDAWQAVAAGATVNGYGTYGLSADGVWTYTLDNDNAAVQALNGAATLTDSFTALTEDGTAQLVTITIQAANDVATITGTATGDVTEAGGIADGTPGAPTATGNLESADVDDPNDSWSVVAPGTGSIGGYGTYAVTADGQWSYALDNSHAAVQALNGTGTLTDAFNAVTADGTAQLVSVTIHAQNDAATVTGDATGAVTESGTGGAGVPTDSGDLGSTDPDNTDDSWVAVAAGAATVNGYGTYGLSADGVWTYTLDNDNAAVQALNGAATLTDSFTALTEDGTAQVVTITINAANDAATITGATTGDVTEAGGVADGTPGTPTATGNLESTDVDDPDDSWTVAAPGTASLGGFGTYQVGANGQWTYTLDNTHAAVQALNGTGTLIDAFNAVTADGTTQLVSVTIHAQNDAATVTGDATGAVIASGSGPGTPTDSGDLKAADVDNTIDSWQAVAAGAATVNGYGTYGLTADGVWTYTLDNGNAAVQALEDGDTLTDTFAALTADGTARIVTVTISAQDEIDPNDAPVNTVPGTQSVEAGHTLAIAGLAVADLDAGAAAITTSLSVAHGTLTVGALGGVAVAGSGSNTVTLTGTVAQINAALGGAGNVVYTPADKFFGSDTLTMTTNDQGNSGEGGPLTDTDTVAITVDNANTPITGTPGPDSFTALPGNARIDALTGVDTITFDFRLVDATVKYEGNTIVIDGPSGSHTLTGFERFVFTDGTVDNSDGSPLVDDLFYYATYHDVWNAHADADAHYDSMGWHENRDPSAFFSTNIYLSANPDVRAGGGNPLTHFDTAGWQEGRIPSLTFDPVQYLAANPDVAAAHIDPLRHYLAFGYEEGRQPFAPTALIAANGFDFASYLANNPDVAAAGVDPLQHFQTFGWQEGRNPNALFDVDGYLAAYADVAAAGVNPLDHYNQFGWREGRDPSAGFDTTDYLAANPDVAAAEVNPLIHFLHDGIREGRVAFADGVWG